MADSGVLYVLEIEGVNADQSRIDTLILGKPLLKDRDEEEVRGYRDALAKKG